MAREKETEILTVAAVRESGEILFNERQQIFTPAMKGTESLGELKANIRKRVPVKASLDTKRGTVEKIEPVGAEEIEAFRRMWPVLDNPSKAVRVNVTKLDPIEWNVVGTGQNWPAFDVCNTIIPNFTKAKQMFDFCAKQTCSLGGPFDVSPCIPFQFVKDGCFARAHKMRKIITEKYRFCCEKVFAFANQGDDRLAVKANKWGGCCVEWWYHVVPLVRVRFTFGPQSLVFAMVFDPGIFNEPVTLTTWLAALEVTGCNPNAHVSSYSVQPGTAYAPANLSGLVFTTDDNYMKTDQKLNEFKNLVTC